MAEEDLWKGSSLSRRVRVDERGREEVEVRVRVVGVVRERSVRVVVGRDMSATLNRL